MAEENRVPEQDGWNTDPNAAYDAWKLDPTPDNMARVITSLEPTINSEVQRYQGSKPILRGRAKVLATKAVHKYDPSHGAKLRSWVVTQLQPLSRYGQQMRPIHASEMAIRQAAEVNRIKEEMSEELGRDPTDEEIADKTGISVARIKKVQKDVMATVPESSFTETSEEDGGKSMPGVIAPDVITTAKEMVYESLSPRDKQIYDWKIGAHGKSVLANQVIARRLGITPALVSQRSKQIAYQIRDLAERGV